MYLKGVFPVDGSPRGNKGYKQPNWQTIEWRRRKKGENEEKWEGRRPRRNLSPVFRAVLGLAMIFMCFCPIWRSMNCPNLIYFEVLWIYLLKSSPSESGHPRQHLSCIYFTFLKTRIAILYFSSSISMVGSCKDAYNELYTIFREKKEYFFIHMSKQTQTRQKDRIFKFKRPYHTTFLATWI